MRKVMYHFETACVTLFMYVTVPFVFIYDVVCYKIALHKCDNDAEFLDGCIRDDLRRKGVTDDIIDRILGLIKKF